MDQLLKSIDVLSKPQVLKWFGDGSHHHHRRTSRTNSYLKSNSPPNPLFFANSVCKWMPNSVLYMSWCLFWHVVNIYENIHFVPKNVWVVPSSGLKAVVHLKLNKARSLALLRFSTSKMIRDVGLSAAGEYITSSIWYTPPPANAASNYSTFLNVFLLIFWLATD